MNIVRVPSDGAEYVYKVIDGQSLQGQYFVIVDPDGRTVTITSIDLEGNPDAADMLLLAARVNDPEYDQDSDSISWPYTSDNDLRSRLTQLIGNDSAIVLTDLGLAGDADPDDPDWQAAMTAEPGGEVSVVTPDPVQAGDYSFEFDPAGDTSTAVPPADADVTPGGTPGGTPDEFDVPEPEPGPGEAPDDDGEDDDDEPEGKPPAP